MIALLLKASIIIAFLLVFYKAFLERESFFATNRIYLLGCLVIAFVLPFISLPELIEQQGFVAEVIEEYTEDKEENLSFEISDKQEGISSLAKEQSNDNSSKPELKPAISEDEKTSATIGGLKQNDNIQKGDSEKQEISLLSWISMFYFFGVIIFTLNFIFQIGSIVFKIIKSEDKIKDFKCTIINSPIMTEPCSFFNYIFINPESYNYDTYEQILSHEKIHVKKFHTIDLLLSEIAVIILWFNPLIWLLRKEVEKNIEYQTDDLLLNGKTVERELYQMNLLKVATYNMPLAITTNYNQSLIKQRIIKMSSKKSNPHSYWKYAFIAPILFAILLLISKPSAVIAQAFNKESFTNEKDDTSEILVSKNSNTLEEDNTKNTEDLTSENALDVECKALLKAIKEEDISKVEDLLKTTDVDCIDNNAGHTLVRQEDNQAIIQNPRTPLVMAAKVGNVEIGKLLIKSKVKVNFYHSENETPLMAAAALGHLDFVKLLIENGAEINKEVEHEGTALFRAALNGHLETVKYLCAKGAKINIEIENVGTPLFAGSRSGNLEIVKYLHTQGAKINVKIENEGTPLLAAARSGNQEVVKYLHNQGAKVDVATQNVGTPLLVAAKKGHLEIVKYLHTQGAKIDVETQNVGTPLLAAAKKGNLEVVKYLLSKGAEIDKVVENVGTPLLYAARNGKLETVKYLLSQKAEIDKVVENEGTPLLYAARNGNLETVKYLLSQGAKIDKAVANEGTPLLYAARNGNLETVKYLLSQGAEIDKAVANVGTPLLYAARNGNLEMVQYLLSQGADVDKQVDNLGTALTSAVRNENYEVMKILLENGADPYLNTQGIEYPMFHARNSKNKAIVELLKKYEKNN